MPEMDGYETTRELRRREQAGGMPRTPVVALTANVLPEDRRRCFEAGMDDFLAKPVRIEDLARVVSEQLARAPGIRRRSGASATSSASRLSRRCASSSCAARASSSTR